ncbi:MAG: S24/S26 family peptidase [Pseudomonadota bacterium]
MLKLFRVRGESMYPTYAEGSRVLTLKLPSRWLKQGMPVVANVADDTYIVKRVREVIDERYLVLSSDNEATRSRYCGIPFQSSKIVGKVVAAF